MAKIPDFTALGEAPVPNVPTGVSSFRGTSGEEELGRAIAGTGDKFMQFAAHEQDLLDTTKAEDAWNNYKNSALDLSVGDNGFANKKSGDAVNGDIFKTYTGKLSDARKAIESTLTTPEQRRKFSERATITDLQFKDNILRHYQQERASYEKTTFDGTVAAAKAMVSAAPTDQTVFDTAMLNLNNRAEAMAKFLGYTDKESVASLKNKLSDDLYTTRIDALLYNKPMVAESLFRLVEDKITNPELKLTLQARVREASTGVRATVDADQIIADVRSGPSLTAKLAPGTREAELAKLDAAIKANPSDQSLIQAKFAIENSDTETGRPLNTNGLPNARDIRAQLPIMLTKVESRADTIFGTDKGNPDRAAYVARLTNELKAKVQLEATQLDAIQKESQGKLIDAIAGFNGGSPITAFSQIQANPDLMRAWQMSDPQAKLGLERLMQYNVGQQGKGNDELYWKVWNRIHQEPGNPDKIDFYQQILPFAGPGQLSTEQIGRLRQELDRSETPGGRSVSQLMRGSATRVEQYFRNHLLLTAQPDRQIAATMRWTEDVGKRVDAYVKAGKDVRTLFQIDSPDSVINPKVLDTYANSTPALGLANSAAQVKAGQPPLSQPPAVVPGDIKTVEQRDAWLKTLPPNVTHIQVPGESRPRAIPGRTGQPIPTDAVTTPNYGKREDGTDKGQGYFGELKRPDGDISTELSIGVNIDGKERQIPAIVPTLTAGELEHLVSGKQPTKEIVDKAVAHARERIAAGKDPFAQPGEQAEPPKGVAAGGSSGEPELVDQVTMPKRSTGGMTKEQLERRQKIGEALNEMSRFIATGGLMRRGLEKLGQALGTVFRTEDEGYVAGFQAIKRGRQYTVEMEPIIEKAVESGQLSAKDEAIARSMLKRIAAKREAQ